MPRSFVGRVSGLAALIGCVFIVILTVFGYSFIRAFRADDEAISTYAEEMTLGEALEEAVQRKLADGRGHLLAHDDRSWLGFQRAAADEKNLFANLRSRVKS